MARKPRRRKSEKIGVIKPSLDDIRPAFLDQAAESKKRAHFGRPAPYAESMKLGTGRRDPRPNGTGVGHGHDDMAITPRIRGLDETRQGARGCGHRDAAARRIENDGTV